MYLKAITAGEVIACNTSEDLFSSFRSLYYAKANDFGVFKFFFLFSPRGNKLTYMVHSFLN